MLNIFKKHYLAIILAFIVGSLTLLPQLFAVKGLGNDFKGVYPAVSGDQIYYLVRGQDIIDGHSFLSNPYLFEHKQGSPMHIWLPDYLMAKPLSILKIDIVHGYMFYDFLLTFILTILSYIAVYLLTNYRFYGLAAAAILHLGLFLEEFNRAPSPQFNFIFWLLVLICIIKFIKSNKNIYLILSGLFLGSLFYFYTYYWTFYFVILFIFIFLGMLFKKNNFNPKSYFYLIAGAMVMALPYFISIYESSKLPYYKESLVRLGMLNTHFPSGLKIIAISIAVLIIFFVAYKKKIIQLDIIELFLLAGGLAGAISVNQHIITGKNLEFSSHYQPETEFFLVIILFYLLSVFIKKYPGEKLKRYILAGVIILVILFSSFNIFKTVKAQIIFSPEDVQRQSYAPIFKWLRDNSQKDDVVYANNDISELIPIYTADNVYFCRSANMFFVSNNEVEERYAINNYWEEIDIDSLVADQRSVWGTQYLNEYGHNLSRNKLRKLFFLSPKEYVAIPSTELERVLAEIHRIQQDEIYPAIKKYKVDYIVWDKNKNPYWSLSSNSKFKELYRSGDIYIYKII